jgi:GNAT superfamily N-acetyltransferase
VEEIGIRKAILSDLPYLYDICLKTGDEGKDASALFKDPYLIGHYYAAPYLSYQKSICYVAEYECRPQGYILSVPDTAAFNQWMEEYWLPPLRNNFSKYLIEPCSEKEKMILSRINKKHYPIDTTNQSLLKHYPAHLHIDLLPNMQGKGIGKILMNNLFDELIKQDVSGLSFGVGMKNKGAITFYQKFGFSIYAEYDWGIIMCKALKNESIQTVN